MHGTQKEDAPMCRFSWKFLHICLKLFFLHERKKIDLKAITGEVTWTGHLVLETRQAMLSVA
ncbi:MAG: hypothetical protein EZS26_001586 [Candidatus Ordinivivax streblomastigis]|uniref:Uncharacterized protein n=1 Tax=Candidatus Ordinivivax streblomastigis TaxID=2540710 RepID=A0A5M8P1I8_9BACT|nr:MAG: hypothetical protein EZS26_001586 [Candidatus Ordinivivax streblomastigis]